MITIQIEYLLMWSLASLPAFDYAIFFVGKNQFLWQRLLKLIIISRF